MKKSYLLVVVLAGLTIQAVYADSKQLVPLSNMLFNPSSFSFDTEGTAYADPNLWQSGKNGLYTGKGDSLKGFRLAVDSKGLISAVTPSDLLQPDAGWKDIVWTAMKAAGGTRPSKLQDSKYISALTLGENKKVESQTQCVEGACLTVTPKGCQKFIALSKSNGIDDLLEKVQKCSDLRMAYENTFKDKEVASEMKSAFEKDTVRIGKSSINNSVLQTTSGNIGLYLAYPSDQSFIRSFQQLYVESCRAHFKTGPSSGVEVEGKDKAVR